MYTACEAGAFPVVVQFVVNGDMPAALRGRFPEGRAPQFVLDDHDVTVFESDPVARSSAATP